MGRSTRYTDPENTPAVMMEESLERRVFSAEFDDSLLTFKIIAGRDGKNAVISSWKDPIRDHSACVLEVEALLEVHAEKSKLYKREKRTLKNWETGFQLLNSRPDDLRTYIELKDGMKTFMERLAKVKTPEEHEELEAEYRKFKELQGRSERLLEAQQMLERCREDLDEALKVMLQASKDLEAARKREEELAELISDDHVESSKRGIGMQELFPKIKPGMVISKLHHIDLEDLSYDEVMKQLHKARRPHYLELKRYDYRQDVLSGEWASLQAQRVLGRFVTDPRVAREAFVAAGRRGEYGDIELALHCGEDVNATDTTGCTAFHHAVANGHIECMELLFAHGANIEQRDSNLETPLLQACRRGNMRVIAWLLERNASLDAKDKQLRTAVFHAILSRNVPLVAQLVQLRTAMTVML